MVGFGGKNMFSVYLPIGAIIQTHFNIFFQINSRLMTRQNISKITTCRCFILMKTQQCKSGGLAIRLSLWVYGWLITFA